MTKSALFFCIIDTTLIKSVEYLISIISEYVTTHIKENNKTIASLIRESDTRKTNLLMILS